MARRARSIYKRKDGRYEARYLKGRDENGKAIYGSVYAKKYAEVKIKLEKATLKGKAIEASVESRTVVSKSEAYLSSIKRILKLSSYGIYSGYIKNHIYSYFQNMKCNQLTIEELQGFVDRLTENGLSAATVQLVFSFLKSSLCGAVPQDILNVTLPKCALSKSKSLSIGEQKRLENAAKSSDDIDYIAVMLCLYTGLRVGELCGLMWDDVDFEHRLIHVRRTIQRIKNPDCTEEITCSAAKTTVICSTPKSDSSLRSIPLPEFLHLLLMSEYSNHSHDDVGYVISRDGTAIEPHNMQYCFEKLLAAANIMKANFHITRHTFATRALETGFVIKPLSEILGHSSAAITLKFYAHAMNAHKHKCMESLESVFRLAA